MGEQVAVKGSGSTGCAVLGTHAKNVVRITAEHAATEATEITATKTRDGINGVVVRDGRLIPGHGLFGGRNVNANMRGCLTTGESGNIVGNRWRSVRQRGGKWGSVSSYGWVAIFGVEAA